jgi:hypothetical protein
MANRIDDVVSSPCSLYPMVLLQSTYQFTRNKVSYAMNETYVALSRNGCNEQIPWPAARFDHAAWFDGASEYIRPVQAAHMSPLTFTTLVISVQAARW